MTPEQQRALALARARLRLAEQGEGETVTPAAPADPRERQAQGRHRQALGRRRLGQAAYPQAAILAPSLDLAVDPERRQEFGRVAGQLAEQTGRNALTMPAALGQAIVSPFAALSSPNQRRRTVQQASRAADIAGRSFDEAGQIATREAPGAMRALGGMLAQRGRDVGQVIEHGALPAILQTGQAAVEHGPELLRAFTYEPWETNEAEQSALMLERERQGLGLPAREPLSDIAGRANAATGRAVFNTALAPANAALLRPVARAIPQGARALAGALRGRTPSQRAVRMIDRRLQQADRTVDDLRVTSGRLSRQGGGTQETIAEIGGKPLQNAARAVANVEGPGQQIAETFLAERADRVGQRVMSEVTRAAQPQQTRAPRDYWDASDALATARSGQAREGYQTLYAYGKTGEEAQTYRAAVQQRLLPYLRDAPPEAAASGARQLSTEAAGLRAQVARAQQSGASPDRIRALMVELDDVLISQRQLEGIATGKPPPDVTTRAVDYFQRGLSQMERTAGMGTPEARAIGNARRAFNGMADDLIPPFNDVRTRFAAAERIQEFMDQGRRVFSMAEGEVNLMLRGQGGRGLSMEEFDGFMLGVMDALQTKIRAGDTSFVARFMRNENWQAQIERALTPPPDRARAFVEAARTRAARRGRSPAAITRQEIAAQQERMGRAATKRLFSRIEREAHMQDFNNAVRSGARTTPMAQDIKGLTTGEDSFGFIGEIIEGGGNVKVWGLRTLARAWDKLRRPGIYDPEVNRELATRLFQPATTGNVAKLREELAALRSQGVRLPAGVERDLTKVANAMANIGTAGAIGLGAAAAGDAQAQEGSAQLAQVRRDLRARRADLEVIERASRTEAPEDVMAAQRILRREGLYSRRIDGQWGGGTSDANRQFQQQLRADIADLERQEAYLSTRPTEEQLSARHNLPTYALLGGAVLGHLAHFPGQGFNRGANALRVRGMNRSVTSGSPEQRATSMNSIYGRGGAPSAQQPYSVSESGQFTPNRNVAPESSLFQPRSPVAPYLSEFDLLLGTAAAGEIGITGQFVLPAKERELREAREALGAPGGRTAENYRRVEELENDVANMTALRNGGIGLLGGQLARGAGSALLRDPTYRRPQPDWALIQRERAALNRHFRTEAQTARRAQTQANAQTQAVRAEAQARRAQAQAERAEAQERLASAQAAKAQAQAARAEAQAESARLRAQERAARERRQRRRAPPRES